MGIANLGHGNLINIAGSGAYGHVVGPAAGARSLRRADACWQAGADPADWAGDHGEFARAFASFPQDTDRLSPGWRQKLRAAARGRQRTPPRRGFCCRLTDGRRASTVKPSLSLSAETFTFQ